MIILFTEKNEASRNIAGHLMKLGFAATGKDGWLLNGVRLLNTHAKTVLDVPTDFETDCLLVLSTHKSVKPRPMLTVHFPGNWGNAGLGGTDKTLNIAYAGKLRQLFLALVDCNKRNGLGWEVCIEADHHGPNCEVPMIFIEIGSSEEEWKNENAGKTVAMAVLESLDPPKPAKAFFGVGGGHYAKEFSAMMLEKQELAVGHILPKYAIDEADDETLKQALDKNVEKVERIIVLKESTNAKQKHMIAEFAERNGIPCEMV